MRILYFDCAMGAAGDMLTSALLELFPHRERITAELNSLGLPHIRFVPERAEKQGIVGTHMAVFVDEQTEEDGHCHHNHHDHHDHHHTGLAEIRRIVSQLNVSQKVAQDILSVYDCVAQAEGLAHGVAVEQVHFHEVGAMDAIADITAVCYLLEKLEVDRIIASPVHVGSGQVHCAHGILPVPAPATANILKGIPIYGGEIRGELCTPTGAALLRHFVSQFGSLPPMTVDAIGYGCGKKDFPAANCVRALLGHTAEEGTDTVVELSCNLDDMTGEALGFAMERLLEAGALDVFTLPIGMKKSRPGTMLTVLCQQKDETRLAEMMLRHTTSLGVRRQLMTRYTLKRSCLTADTPLGKVRIKTASGYGISRRKPEYEDLAEIARANGLSVGQVLRQVERSLDQKEEQHEAHCAD